MLHRGDDNNNNKKEENKKEDEQLPRVSFGENGVHFPFIHEGETKSPPQFNEASLLTARESAGKNVDDKELQEAMKERPKIETDRRSLDPLRPGRRCRRV